MTIGLTALVGRYLTERRTHSRCWRAGPRAGAGAARVCGELLPSDPPGPLASLQGSLEGSSSGSTAVLPCDLADPAAVQQLLAGADGSCPWASSRSKARLRPSCRPTS